MAEMSDDLPAFGNPTRPASAIVLSSSRSSLCSPGSPRNAKPGALRLVEASAALPRPPCPPCAATNSVHAPIRSASTSPSPVFTTVPSGTLTIRSAPSAPLRCEPAPALPLPARRSGRRWKSSSVAVLGSTLKMTSPPRPRREPNSTGPVTSANRVSSPPRPTPTPGWKCVPRWRTRISPALTTWPPNRLTPSRWALESRPFLLDEAPFLCAISDLLLLAGAGLARSDAGDLHLRVLLPVALAAPVTGLVLVVDHVDLRAGGWSDDLSGDFVGAQLGAVADHLPVIHDKHRGQRHRGADLTCDHVYRQGAFNRRPTLPSSPANHRLHGRTL